MISNIKIATGAAICHSQLYRLTKGTEMLEITNNK
jgi:hypothetical protein